MEKQKCPEIRFSGFDKEWMERSWRDTVEISTNMVDPRNNEYGELFHIGPGNIKSFSGQFYDNVLKVKDSNLISGKFYFRKGDIIYGKINPQLAKYVIAPFEGLASADAYVLNTKNGVIQNYLYAILQTNDFYKYTVSVSSRTGMPKINRDELNIYNYFSPSEAEQTLIGKFLQNLVQSIALHEKKLAQTQIFKKAMLEKMFPKLGSNCPEIRLKGFSDDWKQYYIGDLTRVCSGARVHKDEWTSSGVPFFRSSDVVSTYKGNENTKAYISFSLFEKLIQSTGRLEKGDLLVTGGGSIGIPYLVPNNEPLYSKDADLIWIKKSPKIDSKFLYTFFATDYFRKYIESISHIGTIAHYTIEQVKATPVCLPSLSEQEQIGEFFKQLDETIKLQKQQLQTLKNLKQALLEKMFV